jgi:formate dehydrogenase maturation protein FdhE
MTSSKHGGRPLDATLAYLDLRQENYPYLSNALAVYGQVFCIQDRYYQSFEPETPESNTKNEEEPMVPGRLPGLDVSKPLALLAEISDAFAAAAPNRRSEIEAARASCRREDVILRSQADSDHKLSPTAYKLLLLALNPFFEKLALRIVPEIEEHVWRFGHCPVCGESPSVAGYEVSAGARFVQCRLCRTQWMLGRIGCVFCGCEDTDKLGYLRADDDSAHRVEVCDSCGGYLKVVDERALMTESILHVEELLMSALDREAITRGYGPGRSRPRKEEALYGS